MAKINRSVKTPAITTHEGGRAKRIGDMAQLRRSVLACMLWEDTFYESGEQIADRISRLVGEIQDTDSIAQLAVDARSIFNLRHAPLLLAVAMVRNEQHRKAVGELLPKIIQRPDEIGEFMAIYWKDGRCPIAKQVKIGLSAAFNNFNEYQLAKFS